MKASHYLAIGIRLLSIVLLFFALSQVSTMISIAKSNLVNGVPVSIFFILGTLLYPLALSIFLWFFPFSISNMILRPEVDRPVEIMNAPSILTVLILFVGLYFLFYAIVDSVYWMVYWNMVMNSEYTITSDYGSVDGKASTIATVIELLMSILIIFKAKKLSLYLLRIAK